MIAPDGSAEGTTDASTPVYDIVTSVPPGYVNFVSLLAASAVGVPTSEVAVE
jgi:hypothetical protein